MKRYNHNLEAPREVFPSICTTHTYDDRVATARLAIDAGMELCCGGILGMGETLEQRVDFAFELAELEPCEVPINFLLPTGTPLGDQRLITPREALQAIALFRLVLPSAWLRLAGGREFVLGELQAMGLLAGANALIVGNYLTIDRPAARGRPRAARGARHARRRRSRARDGSSSTPTARTPGPHAGPRASASPSAPSSVSVAVRSARPRAQELLAGSGQVEVVLADEHPAHEEADDLLDHHDPPRRQQRVVREVGTEERPPEQLGRW